MILLQLGVGSYGNAIALTAKGSVNETIARFVGVLADAADCKPSGTAR
jgi:hypothetical protein